MAFRCPVESDRRCRGEPSVSTRRDSQGQCGRFPVAAKTRWIATRCSRYGYGNHRSVRMKLLHVATARTIWLFTLLDLNPRGQAFTQDTIDKISARYKFKGPPTISAALKAQKDSEPIYFADGEFMSASGINVVVDLKVYN